MNDDIVNSEERQKGTIAKAKELIGKLSKEDMKEYADSKMELLPWLELKFNCPNIAEWLNWEKDHAKPKKADRANGKNARLPIGTNGAEKDDPTGKRKIPDLKFRRSHVFFYHELRIVITAISRALRDDEVTTHRSANCALMEKCLGFAGRINIPSFSCFLCPQKCNPEVQDSKLDICEIARI